MINASIRRCILPCQSGTLGETPDEQKRQIGLCSSDIGLASEADMTSLRPVTIRISLQVGIARGVGAAPIPAPAVMAEAAPSGGTNMGPTNLNMGPAATEAAEVTTGEMGTAKMTTSKMTTAKMTTAKMTAASMTASAPGEGRRWHYGSTQKSSHHGHDHRFSQHRSLRQLVRSIKVSVRARCRCRCALRSDIDQAVSRAF
jgi:hypothetical protein